jgi:hypothetical protein
MFVIPNEVSVMTNKLFITLVLVAVALGSFGCGAMEPRSAEAARAELCGTATVLDLQVRTEPTSKELIYTVAFKVNDTVYTAESVGGRIALFGPFVENAQIDLCVIGQQLTLITPSDEDPEVLSYTMNVIRKVRVQGPNSTS